MADMGKIKLYQKLMAGFALTLLAACNGQGGLGTASDDGSAVMSVLTGPNQSDFQNIQGRTYWLECDGAQGRITGQQGIQGQILSEAQSGQAQVKFQSPQLANANGRWCHIEVRGSDNAQYTFKSTFNGAVQRGLYFTSTNAQVTNQQLNTAVYRTYQAGVQQGPVFTGLLYVQFPLAIQSINLNGARAALVCNGQLLDSSVSIQAQPAQGNQNALITFPSLNVQSYTGKVCNDVSITDGSGNQYSFANQRNYSFSPVANANITARDGDGNTYAYPLKSGSQFGQPGSQEVSVSSTFAGDCAGTFEINTSGQQCTTHIPSAD